MRRSVLNSLGSRAKAFQAQLYLSPGWVVVSSISIYFLAHIIAVNIIALYGAVQGWSIGRIEDWLSVSLAAKFALRIAVAVVGILLVRACLRLLRSSWRAIGMVRPKLADIPVAFIGFGWYILLHLAAVFMIGILVPGVDFDGSQQLGFDMASTGGALAVIFVSLVMLPPLYEEILMRGLLFTGIRSRLSLPVTAVAVSLLFALAHLEWGGAGPLLWAAGIDTFVLSVVLVYVRERTGSLWPAIGLHAIKNCIAFMLLFVFRLQ